MPKPKTPKTPDPSETEETETEDDGDEASTAKELDNRINSIVTNRLKRFGEQFTKTIETTIATALSKKPETEETEETEETDGKRGKSKPDPKLSKMERELKEARDKLAKADEDRKAAEDKSKRDEERSILENALTEAGISDKALRGGALAMLMGEGKIVRDEEGKVKWKGQDKYGQDTYFDPNIAAKTWVKTDGKAFQPAVDAGGSGASRPNSGKIPKAQWDQMTARDKAKEQIRRASLGLPALDE